MVVAVGLVLGLANRLARRFALPIPDGVALLLATQAAVGLGEAATLVGHLARALRGRSVRRTTTPRPLSLGFRAGVRFRQRIRLRLSNRLRGWFGCGLGNGLWGRLRGGLRFGLGNGESDPDNEYRQR